MGSFIQLDQSGGREMLGGHQSARLWELTVELFLNKKVEVEEADIYLTAADLRPELTTRLSGRSPLRNITDITAQDAYSGVCGEVTGDILRKIWQTELLTE